MSEVGINNSALAALFPPGSINTYDDTIYCPMRQIWITGLYDSLGANFHYEVMLDHYLTGELS